MVVLDEGYLTCTGRSLHCQVAYMAIYEIYIVLLRLYMRMKMFVYVVFCVE